MNRGGYVVKDTGLCHVVAAIFWQDVLKGLDAIGKIA